MRVSDAGLAWGGGTWQKAILGWVSGCRNRVGYFSLLEFKRFFLHFSSEANDLHFFPPITFYQ